MENPSGCCPYMLFLYYYLLLSLSAIILNLLVSDGHILFVWPKRIWKEKSTKEGARKAPSLETPLGAEIETASCHIISA